MTHEQLRKLRRLVVGMIGAASAYEKYARGWKDAAERDPFKKTRVKDFERAAELGKELLLEMEARQ